MNGITVNSGFGLWPCASVDNFETYLDDAHMQVNWGVSGSGATASVELIESDPYYGFKSLYADDPDDTNEWWVTVSMSSTDFSDYNGIFFGAKKSTAFRREVKIEKNGGTHQLFTGSGDYSDDDWQREYVSMSANHLAAVEGISWLVGTASVAWDIYLDEVMFVNYDSLTYPAMKMHRRDAIVTNGMRIPGRHGRNPNISCADGGMIDIDLFVPATEYEDRIQRWRRFKSRRQEMLLVTNKEWARVHIVDVDVTYTGGKDKKIIAGTITLEETGKSGVFE